MEQSRATVVASASPGKAALVVATPLVLCNDSSTADRRLDRSRRDMELRRRLARNFLTMVSAGSLQDCRLAALLLADILRVLFFFPRLNTMCQHHVDA